LCCGLSVVSVMLICVTVICDMFTKASTPWWRATSGGVDRGFQVGRRDRHSEIDAPATFDGAVHRGEVRQVALYDLCAEPP
jgi:hypothetical protein